MFEKQTPTTIQKNVYLSFFVILVLVIVVFVGSSEVVYFGRALHVLNVTGRHEPSLLVLVGGCFVLLGGCLLVVLVGGGLLILVGGDELVVLDGSGFGNELKSEFQLIKQELKNNNNNNMIYLGLGITGTLCIKPTNTMSDFSILNTTILVHGIAFGAKKGQTNDRLSCIAC